MTFTQKQFENYIATKPSSKESAGAWSRFKNQVEEARKKDEALKPRQETTMERINRIKYQYNETDKRPQHLDKQNIKTWEQSIEEKSKKTIKKVKPKIIKKEIEIKPDISFPFPIIKEHPKLPARPPLEKIIRKSEYGLSNDFTRQKLREAEILNQIDNGIKKYD